MLFARARLLGATSFLALCSLNTTAQAQSTGETLDLGTLILGELQTRTLQESPTSAIVETGEELEKRGDVDIYDVVERAPNVSTTFGNKGFIVRGIQTNGAVSNAQLNGTLVSVQVDGVALNNYQATFFGPYSTWDLDQIEILRGPQSTQQGRNALAGAVIINTRDPIFENEYRFRVEGGSRNTRRFALSYNQVFSDQLAFRFAAENHSEDGWVTSQTRNDDRYDARNYEAYRAKLRWKPTDRFDAVLEYSYTDSEGGEDYVQNSLFPGARVSNDTFDAVEGSITRIYGLTTSYDINTAWSLETQTHYYDQDYTRFEGDALPLAPTRTFNNFSSEARTFEQDLQLAFDFERTKGVVGLFYTESEDTRPFRLITDLSALGAPGFSDFVNQDFDTEIENFAIYGEADIDLSDNVFLTVGARYDFETFRYRQALDFGPILNGFGIPDVASRRDSSSFDAFLPKLGITYEFAQDQLVNFTIQRGYRAGGSSSNLAETLNANPAVNPISDYDPEFSTNYEIAYRGSFRDDTVRVGANVFFTQWEDIQTSVPGVGTGNPALFAVDAQFNQDTVNAAEAEVYGFELSVEAQPTSSWSVFANLGYNQTEYTNFVTRTPAGAVFQNFSGNEFPFAPEWTGAFGAEYTWNNGFTLGADVSYKAATFQDNANTYKDDDRWLVNVQGSYPINDRVTAGFYVRNLFDDDYRTARFFSPAQPPSAGPPPTPGSPQTDIVRTGEPRTIGAYIQAEF